MKVEFEVVVCKSSILENSKCPGSGSLALLLPLLNVVRPPCKDEWLILSASTMLMDQLLTPQLRNWTPC